MDGQKGWRGSVPGARMSPGACKPEGGHRGDHEGIEREKES